MSKRLVDIDDDLLEEVTVADEVEPALVREQRVGVEVVRLASEGLTNQLIAERLSLSPHTIARHLANARAKLGAANRAEAAAKLEEMQV